MSAAVPRAHRSAATPHRTGSVKVRRTRVIRAPALVLPAYTIVAQAPHQHLVQALRHPRPRALAWLGLVGILDSLAAILTLHLTSLQQEPEHMSQFANTPFWLLWDAAICSFVIGGAALSLAVRPHLGRSVFQRLGVWLLWLSAAGAIVLTALPMDAGHHPPTLGGAIHGVAAMSMFLLLGGAMALLAPAFRSNPAWRSFGVPSLAIGTLVIAASTTYLIATVRGGTEFAAFSQRIVVGLIAMWFVALALRLLSKSVTSRAVARSQGRARNQLGQFTKAMAGSSSRSRIRRQATGVQGASAPWWTSAWNSRA